MNVTSSNPSFRGDVNVESAPASGGTSNWKKVVAILGVVAVSTGVGVAIGQASAGSSDAPSSSGSGGGSQLGAVAQAQQTLQASVDGSAAEAFSAGMNATVLQNIVAEYEADPAGWSDEVMTREIMEALVTIRDDEALDGTRERRAMRASKEETLEAYRELATSVEAEPAIAKAWEQIRTSSYPGAMVTSNGLDQVTVYRTENRYCWVLAQESNDPEDWQANLDVGSTDILSTQRFTRQDDSCPCLRTRWWWCAERASCNVFISHGKAFDGFVKPYNELRQVVADRINSECRANDEYIFTGTSRGAAIATIFAQAVYTENLLTRSQMKLITFGSPRVLATSTSDAFHNRIDTSRLVYRRDPVPSLPYSWMGFKHVGDNVCNSCPYESGRDKPGFAWGVDGGIGDHTGGYDTWFPSA